MPDERMNELRAGNVALSLELVALQDQLRAALAELETVKADRDVAYTEVNRLGATMVKWASADLSEE